MTASPAALNRLLSTITHYSDRLVAVVIHLNDTYVVDERPEQQLPGFARVTATVKHLRDHVRQTTGEDRTLLLHSGDFLGPSRVSKETQGRLMVQLLNEMGLDYCLLGNHEFDYGERVLCERLEEARFGVLLSNVTTESVRLIPEVLWPSAGAPAVALTGVVSETVHRSFGSGWKLSDPTRSLHAFSEQTRDVPFHLVLTHATREEDRALRTGLPSRTYLLGGHDHDIHWSEEDGRPLYKNLSNLETVRVILLLAGGATPWLTLFARHSKGLPDPYENPLLAGWAGEAVPEDRYHRYIDWLFEPMSAIDVAVFRKHLPTTPPRVDPGKLSVLPVRIRHHLEALILDRVGELALAKIPNEDDEVDFVLSRVDHLPPDPGVQELLDREAVTDEAEGDVICDFTGSTGGDLEARDNALRRQSTDFGVFVAACVQAFTDADWVLLNSGMFRCDTLLPSRLRLRDLRDAFLYDSPSAVVVLELPISAAEAAWAHGRAQAGSGAFPQVFPAGLPDKASLRVAISHYLVGNERSVDGYAEVIAERIGETPEELRRRSDPVANPHCSVIEAIRVCGASVPYRTVAASAAESGVADNFIRLANPLLELLGNPPSRSPHWKRLGDDDPLTDTQIEGWRAALRTLLRDLPEVRAFTDEVDRQGDEIDELPEGAQSFGHLQSLYEMSMARLRSLRGELETHRETFRNRIAYHHLFDRVANGIGGWRT